MSLYRGVVMRRTATLAVVFLILSLALAGCSRVRTLLHQPTPVPSVIQPIVDGDPVVDGLPVGGVSTDCVEMGLCSAIIDVARRELDANKPGHAAIVDVTVHDLGIAVDAESRLVPTITSGTVWVAVFILADGTRSAVRVGSAGLPANSPLDAGLVVDGFTLGAPASCMGPTEVPGAPTPLPDTVCFDFPALAQGALDARDPNHAGIVSVDQYSDGTQPGSIDVTGAATAPPQATWHPGPAVDVFVFTLADGTRRATGVACDRLGPCVGVGSYPTN
jgi:hypothetical protein